MPLETVTGVTFAPTGMPAGRREAVTLHGQESRAVLELIDFSNPLVYGPQSASTLVGQLTLRFEAASPVGKRAFRLLGNTLLQDSRFPSTYYPTSSQLRDLLRNTIQA